MKKLITQFTEEKCKDCSTQPRVLWKPEAHHRLQVGDLEAIWRKVRLETEQGVILCLGFPEESSSLLPGSPVFVALGHLF